MKKIRQLCLLVCTFSALLISIKVIIHNHSPISIFKSLSVEEQEILQNFCVCLLRDSEAGYTLFGTKPVTLLVFEKDPKMWTKKEIFLKKALPILKKFPSSFTTKKFSITWSETKKDLCVYIVNISLLEKTIYENKLLFLKLVAKKSIIEKPLSLLSKKGDFLKKFPRRK